eukprot:8455850-Lingulodinium_polyedra.AAC.1
MPESIPRPVLCNPGRKSLLVALIRPPAARPWHLAGGGGSGALASAPASAGPFPIEFGPGGAEVLRQDAPD